MSSEKDMFIINKIFPNAKDIFAVSGKTTAEIKDDCLFVFDTNSLILPYTTSSESLDEIKKVYTKIIQENRLFIPGQVAREFAKIRPEKIKELFQQLTRKRSKVQALSIGKYPLLNGIKEYDELFKKEQEINSKLKEYSKQLGDVIEHVKEWSWNDPVSQLYKSLFNDSIIVDIEFDENEVKSQLDYRYENKIAPGFEDKSKEDGGIGDLLIWYTILELAEKHQKNVVFVSGDEKKDWFYQVENYALYPKFELITEFRSKAPNKSFNIIKLSELLELYGVNERIIKEVEIEENESLNDSKQSQGFENERIIKDWIIENSEEPVYIVGGTGFPDFKVIDHIKKERIGIEILECNNISRFRFKLDSSLRKLKQIEEKYDRFNYFIIYPEATAMDTVLESLKVFKSMTTTINVDVTIIPGFIRKDKFKQLEI